ncbi:MAG: N-acetylmuramoyl-L-alanine amidase-like domain-containing protein [Ignavibacteria bacterium]
MSKDQEICTGKFSFAVAESLKYKPVNEVIVAIGKSFIGVDYVAHTLEAEGDERLIINLTGLDCTTFIENALVFARCIKSGHTSFEDYQKELTKVRYRGGVINKYPSRLHYFSDWIYDNTVKGIVKDITKDIGGKPCPNKAGFMTKNRDKYAQISRNDEFHNEVKKIEDSINARPFYYIPKSEVKDFENKISNGCLIAITSSLQGLDIAHVGIAVKMEDGRIHFLHASTVGSKVQITEQPLADYLLKKKGQTGILVIQPLEP